MEKCRFHDPHCSRSFFEFLNKKGIFCWENKGSWKEFETNFGEMNLAFQSINHFIPRPFLGPRSLLNFFKFFAKQSFLVSWKCFSIEKVVKSYLIKISEMVYSTVCWKHSIHLGQYLELMLILNV